MPSTSPVPSVWRLPTNLPDDLAAFERNAAQFKEGVLSPTQFQVFRVPQGVYEQRESGAYMLRVLFPAGVALPHQLRQLADVAEEYGNGTLHVTTRQDIQVHRVAVESLAPALRSLAEADLSSKGGGGNTVRNITGCPHAGVCTDEPFDTTPHALALTEFMLNDPQSFQLPRKFKIAFSGCSHDCSGATVNDLGFIAKVRDGVRGFAVYVGGGLGSSSRVGDLLERFVPEPEVPLVAEAIKRVFSTYGNRKDRRLARLRFLIRQVGLDAFRELYREQLVNLRRQPPDLPALRELSNPDVDSAGARISQPLSFALDGGDGARVAGDEEASKHSARSPHDSSPPSSPFVRWLAANVRPQKQAGYHFVEIPLFLGDIDCAGLRRLADVVARHGEKLIRTTQTQNLVLRWVPRRELESLHGELSALGLAESHAPALRDLVACTGAATCRLGICLSRGVAKQIADTLSRSNLDLHALGRLHINISGCPNACGRHPLADIGLHGAARRVDGRLVPHYVLQFGGHVEEGKTQIATGRHAVPAHNVPVLLLELLAAFERSAQRPHFAAFLRAAGADYLETLIAKYRPVPGVAENPSFYSDWGANNEFSMAGRGAGECGAGVIDLIEADLKGAAEALREHQYYRAAALAVRALLVTRGEQANSDQAAFNLFQKYFIEAGLMDPRFQALVAAGARADATSDPPVTFVATPTEVTGFVGAVQSLFRDMDGTLQFPKRFERLNASSA